MGDFNNIIEAALALLITFLIGCIIGWFLRAKIFRRNIKKEKPIPASAVAKITPVPATESTSEKLTIVTPPTSKPETAPKPVISKPVTTKPPKAAIAAIAPTNSPVPTDKPSALKEPRGGNKDDLKKIKGVGPKLEGILNGLGIFHFDQIAKWTRKEIIWVDDYLSFKGRIDRDEWIAQANKLK